MLAKAWAGPGACGRDVIASARRARGAAGRSENELSSADTETIRTGEDREDRRPADMPSDMLTPVGGFGAGNHAASDAAPFSSIHVALSQVPCSLRGMPPIKSRGARTLRGSSLAEREVRSVFANIDAGPQPARGAEPHIR